MPSPDYLWIAGLMQLLEVRRGPFWEPPRPGPPAEHADVLAIADDLEPLMRRLVLGRRKSFALVGLGAALLLAMFVTMWVAPDSVFIYVDVAFVVVLGALSAWFQLITWRDWLVLYQSATIPPSRPAPSPSQIVDGLRRLSDGFSVLGDSASVRVLVAMRETAPLTYQACMHLTVPSSAVQRAARAA